MFKIQMKLTERPMMKCVCLSLCYRPSVRAQSTWNSIQNSMLMLILVEYLMLVFGCCLCVKIEILNRNLAQKCTAATKLNRKRSERESYQIWSLGISEMKCFMMFQWMKWIRIYICLTSNSDKIHQFSFK